ncbi:hypothetical protein JOM56_014235 [Amanita muscaria]
MTPDSRFPHSIVFVFFLTPPRVYNPILRVPGYHTRPMPVLMSILSGWNSDDMKSLAEALLPQPPSFNKKKHYDVHQVLGTGTFGKFPQQRKLYKQTTSHTTFHCTIEFIPIIFRSKHGNMIGFHQTKLLGVKSEWDRTMIGMPLILA